MMDVPGEPPPRIELELDEALLLVIALEDAVDVFDRLLGHAPLQITDLIGPMGGIQAQLSLLQRRIGWSIGGDDAG